MLMRDFNSFVFLEEMSMMIVEYFRSLPGEKEESSVSRCER